MLICLAPMEGVVDYPMRELLSGIGGFDRCVTEFVRVTDVLLPERVFFRLCPELEHGCVTRHGTPVHIQLLGGQPDALALNAVRAVTLGAPGIDLNFGCPAKTVNRSDGGSVLLQAPQRVAGIVRAVRDAVDPAIPVSAKIRLGYESSDLLEEVVGGVIEAGASELCVHARTKAQGYKPPADWSRVSSVAGFSDSLRLIINGDIWNVADSILARQESGCHHIMLGRGALSCPDLARQIRCPGDDYQPMAWSTVVDYVEHQFDSSDKEIPRYIGNRTKQWLAYLKRTYPQAELLFRRIKPLHEESAIMQALADHRRLDLTAEYGNELTGNVA